MRTAGAEPASAIRTARLELRPCTYEMARAAMTSSESLGRILGTKIAPGWPSEDLEDAIPVYMAHLERDAGELGWGLWLLIEPTTRVMVGDAGFKGRPDALGRVEIGYGIAPEERGRGFATEAAAGLVAWAAGRGVQLVTAECLDDNAPSIRVLEKTGFRRIGRVGHLIKWEKKVHR
ncbi:MAG: GNAT family N-acetyltransferase [Actinobacteria bacterium]|nr:GNAT family N-acetyltransferase [Actinomycetota bacterium]